MAGRRAAFAVIVAVLAAGCGSTGRVVATPRSSSTTARSTATTTTVRTRAKVDPPPSPRDAAIALSKIMAAAVVLPPGAVPSGEPLPPELRGPWLVPAGGHLVSTRRVWSAPMDPDALVAFLKAHTPSGLFQSGFSRILTRPSNVLLVVEQLGARPVNVAVAGIEIAVEAHAGGSLVNVAAGAQWTVLRPAGEIVGARDPVVVITEVPYPHPQPGSPQKRVVVGGAQRAAIVLAFNRQKVSPTGDAAGGCFALGMNTVSYRVAFAASPTARPDVVATIAPCTPVEVTVGGRPSVSLAWGSGDLDPAVAHALGEQYLSFSSSARS
jgi:hypothetical protein